MNVKETPVLIESANRNKVIKVENIVVGMLNLEVGTGLGRYWYIVQDIIWVGFRRTK